MHCTECRDTLLELTPTQFKVLREVVTGKTNPEIAQSLNYAEKSIKNFVSALFEKTDTHNRTQLAVFALKHHLVELDEV